MNKPYKKQSPDSLIIAIIFLIFGIVLFDLSLFWSAQILCFFSLGLLLWGALFLVVTPNKQVDSSFLVTSTLPSYMTIDRMLKDLKIKGEAYLLPSYAKEVALPENMKGLKEIVTYIPEEHAIGMAAIDDLGKRQILRGES